MTEEKSLPGTAAFGSFNQYYDLLYHEKDYLNETRYITSLINKHCTHATELLELGFGTGNYSLHLSDAGYNITGIEKSEQMAAIAKSKCIPRFFPIVGDITTFKVDRKFDAAVSLFHVMSYLTENISILSCLKHVSEHLNKNGLLIFDVWYTPAVYLQQPQTRIKRIITESNEIIRIGEPVVFFEQNVVQVNYTLIIKNKNSLQSAVLKETHYLRHYSTPEIKLMAQVTGFTFVRCEEFLTGKEPSGDTWGVCYILKKK